MLSGVDLDVEPVREHMSKCSYVVWLCNICSS